MINKAAGDDPGEQAKTEVAEELKKYFRPEFLNRINEVVLFHKLSINQLKQISYITLKMFAKD